MKLIQKWRYYFKEILKICACLYTYWQHTVSQLYLESLSSFFDVEIYLLLKVKLCNEYELLLGIDLVPFLA
jgi:hypothetical protein